MMRYFTALLVVILATVTFHATGQVVNPFSDDTTADSARIRVIEALPEIPLDSATAVSPAPVASATSDTAWAPVLRPHRVIAAYDLRPMVFETYYFLDSIPFRFDRREGSMVPGSLEWLDDEMFNHQLLLHARQNYALTHYDDVKYVESLLPEPPKRYRAEVDPEDAKIVIKEVVPGESAQSIGVKARFKRRNWLHSFKGSVQFSQAFVSPNWYQGGNNNLNMIANAQLDIRLNPAYHPNLLFETTVSYKLGVNSAPDDSIHTYNITEDLFQASSKFGYKAARNWYYSINCLFKTQLLNNYKKNTRTMQAAFLSPGELNFGVGMTYNHTNKKKTFKFDASISPLSYNLKTCINDLMDETTLGIKKGHTTVSEIGSNVECKVWWRLAHNILYQSRFFVFTDYSYVQGDWENTVSFDINRFLSTQIYVHLRYDSSADSNPDWRAWQLKEILSFGFSYTFKSF